MNWLSFPLIYPFLYNDLSWNCKGCASDAFIRICRNLISTYKPFILILQKTWISGEATNTAIKRLGLTFVIHEEVLASLEGYGSFNLISTLVLTLLLDPTNLFILKWTTMDSLISWMLFIRVLNPFPTKGFILATWSSFTKFRKFELSLDIFNFMMWPTNKMCGRDLTSNDFQDFWNCINERSLLELNVHGFTFI